MPYSQSCILKQPLCTCGHPSIGYPTISKVARNQLNVVKGSESFRRLLDGLVLPEAVDAILGLLLDCGVPPGHINERGSNQRLQKDTWQAKGSRTDSERMAESVHFLRIFSTQTSAGSHSQCFKHTLARRVQVFVVQEMV